MIQVPQLCSCVDYFNKLILSDLPVNNCWVAGGSVRDYFMQGYSKSDIDIFFAKKEDMEEVSNFLANRAFANREVMKLYENSRVVTYKVKGNRIDLVKVYFNSPEETISNFDFTVCCAAVDRSRVYVHETFFIDLSKRRLVINNLPYPLSTLQRLQKYIKKGFMICNGGLLQIAKAINDLDLSDPLQNHLEFYPDGSPRFVRID